MRISDWSSDVCSSDLAQRPHDERQHAGLAVQRLADRRGLAATVGTEHDLVRQQRRQPVASAAGQGAAEVPQQGRSEERREGEVCVYTGRQRGWPYHYKKKKFHDVNECLDTI